MKTMMMVSKGWFGLIITCGLLVHARAQEEAPFPPPPEDVSSIAILASDDEPGEKLIIMGTIYKSDKTTPYDGLMLYFYQTDASGVYNKTTGSWKEPRLRGWAKTDANGRYEIRSIKPGSYPNRRQPAHIHVIMKSQGSPAVWLESFLFEDDPYLRPRDTQRVGSAGRFSHIMKINREADGTLQCRRDFTIADP